MLIRLHPGIPSAWEWWPHFERRLIEKAPTLTPHTPVLSLIQLLRYWWGAEPHRFLALARLDDEMYELDAHLLAWIENPWGQNIVLVQQVESDTELGRETLMWGISQLRDWIAELRMLDIEVSHVRFASKRHGAWQEYLKRVLHIPIPCEDEGHIMRVGVQEFLASQGPALGPDRGPS